MGFRSGLDAIIIADSGDESLSGTSPFKLKLGGRDADIQVIRHYASKEGELKGPIDGDGRLSWASAPKLNGIYLYSYLTGQGYQVALIQNFAKQEDLFRQYLSASPKGIVISTPFIFFKNALRTLVKDIRALAPDVFIMAGGAFVNASYLLLERSSEKDYETAAAAGDYLFLTVDEEPDIDLYIASPRGESILCRTLDALRTEKDVEGIPNTARLVDGAYSFSTRIDDASTTPHPDVSWATLPETIFANGVIPLQASNGCPYHCSFCNFTKDRRLIHLKPVNQLIEEMLQAAERGVQYVWFVDDNFRLGRSDLDDVCRAFLHSGLQLHWMCFIRASTLANSDLALLRQAGCVEVQIGLESGDPRILENMNKEADPAMYRQVIGRVLAHGINVSCYFISGFPGETTQTAQATRDFIKSIEHPELPGALSWSIYPFILSPLSPVYEAKVRQKYGLSGYMHKWSHNSMDYRQARQEAVNTFLALEESGPIYRGDNLEMLAELSAAQRKQFYRTRNAMAKQAMRSPIPVEDIINSFSEIPNLGFS